MVSLVVCSHLLLSASTSIHEITQNSRADPAEEKPYKSTPKPQTLQPEEFTGPAYCTNGVVVVPGGTRG